MHCSLNLAPEMSITKETKLHLSCCCYDNSHAAGLVLIKTSHILTQTRINLGGTVASWLVRSTPERAVRVRALAGDIVLCS